MGGASGRLVLTSWSECVDAPGHGLTSSHRLLGKTVNRKLATEGTMQDGDGRASVKESVSCRRCVSGTVQTYIFTSATIYKIAEVY